VTGVNEITLLHQNRLAYYNRWKFPAENGQHVTMDFTMDLPKTKAGHDAFLVVVDKL
jgi:hypothetical protein